MINRAAARARCPAVGGPLERLVRPRWWMMPPLAVKPILKNAISAALLNFSLCGAPASIV